MVVEQIDFVDVQQAAIGGSQYAGFKFPLTFLDRAFNIQRPNNPVFRGADGQIDESRTANRCFQNTISVANAAVITPLVGASRGAAKTTVGDHLYLG